MDTSSSFDDVMLKGAVMSASLAMAITDPHQPDNPIIFINPAFSQMTGYAAASVVGQNCRFLQGPDTNPDAVLKIRAALIARKEIQVDILNYRKDGSPFMNRLFVSPVLNAQGDLVHFSRRSSMQARSSAKTPSSAGERLSYVIWQTSSVND